MKISNTLLLVLFLVLFCTHTGCWKATETADDNTAAQNDRQKSDPAKDVAISVEVEFNGRSENLKLETKVSADATVFSATLAALKENGVDVEHRGEGETAFVVSIGGIANDKVADDNWWVYRVNGELGKVGSGVAQLEKGDRITWSFGKYEPDN